MKVPFSNIEAIIHMHVNLLINTKSYFSCHNIFWRSTLTFSHICIDMSCGLTSVKWVISSWYYYTKSEKCQCRQSVSQMASLHQPFSCTFHKFIHFPKTFQLWKISYLNHTHWCIITRFFIRDICLISRSLVAIFVHDFTYLGYMSSPIKNIDFKSNSLWHFSKNTNLHQ